MKRRRMSTMTTTAIIAVVILGILATAYIYGEYFREAAIVYKDSYSTASISFSDARSGDVINPKVTLTGVDVSYGPLNATGAEGEAAEFKSVPRGTYKIGAKLDGFYDFEVANHKIESTTDTYSWSFAMDNIGTFDWGDTADAGSLTADTDDQVVTVTVYLNNTADDTVLKNVRVKLEAAETHAGITIDDLECTTHAFEEDDLTAEKWIISGYTIGDLDAEVDGVGTNATVVVKYRMTLDVGAAASNIVFTVSVQDLNGVSPETSGSMTITLTAA